MRTYVRWIFKGTTKSIYSFLKAFLNVLFPLIDLKQNGKFFQMVPPENIKLYLKRLVHFLGLEKERLWVCLFGSVVEVFIMFFGTVPFTILYMHAHLLKTNILWLKGTFWVSDNRPLTMYYMLVKPISELFCATD